MFHIVMWRRSIILGIVFCLLIHTGAFAEDIIRLGYVEFPPFTFTNEKGHADGLFIEKVAKTMTTAGLKWKATHIPTKRLYMNLAHGKTDLFLGIKTSPIIQGKIVPPKVKIGNIVMNIYTIGEENRVTTKDELKNKSVGLIRGYAYGSWGKFIRDPANNITHSELSSHKAGFSMLQFKRVDYLIDYEGPAKYTLKEIDVPGLAIETIMNLDCYFVLSNKLPRAEETLRKLEETFLSLYPNN